MRINVTTPWGQADTIEQIANGITFFSTPSHGGYRLTQQRLDEMPAQYRACSFTGDQWFEEDCSWCAVALTWPQYFTTAQQVAAANIFAGVYSQKMERAAS